MIRSNANGSASDRILTAFFGIAKPLHHRGFRHIRTAWRSLALLLTSVQAGLEIISNKWRNPPGLARREEWLNKWCRVVARRLNIHVEVDGSFPSAGLLVSNHLGYLDVIAIGSLSPCVFVAKKEVRRWPIYGILARMANTIFIDRSRPGEVAHAISRISATIGKGSIVVLFPEGTSSDGTQVLPFHSSLFEAAVSDHHPVSCARISYWAEGAMGRDISYWGKTSFLPNLLLLLSLDHISVRIRFTSEALYFTNRKLAAMATRREIIELGQAKEMSARMDWDIEVTRC
jgi:1-acyl-sn-glycerol-3-phosphate acyltransferase